MQDLRSPHDSPVHWPAGTNLAQMRAELEISMLREEVVRTRRRHNKCIGLDLMAMNDRQRAAVVDVEKQHREAEKRLAEATSRLEALRMGLVLPAKHPAAIAHGLALWHPSKVSEAQETSEGTRIVGNNSTRSFSGDPASPYVRPGTELSQYSGSESPGGRTETSGTTQDVLITGDDLCDPLDNTIPPRAAAPAVLVHLDIAEEVRQIATERDSLHSLLAESRHNHSRDVSAFNGLIAGLQDENARALEDLEIVKAEKCSLEAARDELSAKLAVAREGERRALAAADLDANAKLEAARITQSRLDAVKLENAELVEEKLRLVRRLDIARLDNEKLLDESNTITEALRDAQNRLDDVAREKVTAVEEKNALRDRMRAVMRAKEWLLEDLKATKKAKDSLQDRFDAVTREKETILTEKNALQARLECLDDENRKRKLSSSISTNANRTLQSRLDAAIRHNTVLDERAWTNQRRVDGIQAQYDALSREADAKAREQDAVRERLRGALENNHALREGYARLASDRSQLKAALDASEADRVALGETMSQAEEQFAAETAHKVSELQKAHEEELARVIADVEKRMQQAAQDREQRREEMVKHAKTRVEEEKQKADDAHARLEAEQALSVELGLELESAHQQIGKWRLAKDELAASLYAEQEKTRSLQARVTELTKATKPTVFLRRTESERKRQ